ncbi:MAG TPA: flavodoxin-dependent (E)-4-hydroxy-3-methylbut-2-enyl-diphosphate synthase, partial [Ktedonobacterales bacterium]|nr:flavodoxin-dependent (E)-4-hydroxy-3-methylbut-2-enyl-diphosphate synthase [Ktedonobacterales bacterium]
MRRKTRQIHVGNVAIGGNAPIAVQSMTTTYTRDVASTVAQIHRLQDVGCELVRVAVPEEEDAAALGGIKRQIAIPLIADIHYDHHLALEAIKQGVDCIRINPGNLLKKEKGDTSSREAFREVLAACKERGIAMRIGVNSGSIDALDKTAQSMKRVQVRLRDDGVLERTDPAEQRRQEREHLAERMVNKALEYASWCEEEDYHEFKISL